ncbi:MAG: hypothetical protein IKW03_07100 [Clostridia bacterium]|nr:hypothetical protein [Clostridia bacterium]
MKLAKKMLACAMALAMVAALALTAFAAPAITMTATEAVVGETVTVTVAGVDMVGLESADLVFGYDEAALEFVSIVEAESDNAPDLTEGDKFDAGQISFSLLYKKGAQADTAFAVITFKVLKAGATDVTVEVNSWDGTETEAASTKVTVAAEEAPTEADDDVTPPAGDEGDKDDNGDKDPEVIPPLGDAGVAAIAGVMAIAAVAFVATRKKDEE